MITEETRRGMEKVVGVAEEEAEKLQSRIVESRWEEQDSGGYRLHLKLPGDIGLTVTLTRVQLDDQHNVRSSIHQAIERAIRDSDFFVFCVSENSLNRRGHIREEMGIALGLARRFLEDDIYLVPALLEDCSLPTELEDYQAVQVYQGASITPLERSLREGANRRAGAGPGDFDIA